MGKFKRNKIYLWLCSPSILYSNGDPEGILDSVISDPVNDIDKVDGDATEGDKESLHSIVIKIDKQGKQVMIPGYKYFKLKNLWLCGDLGRKINAE